MCNNPVYIEYIDYYGVKRTIPCPCCKCPSCLKDHRNGWMIRLFEESKCWKYVRFVTLTYNDVALPRSVDTSTGELVSTARISDVSNSFKWFRTRYLRSFGQKCDLKYFVCSEYGSNGTKRPHYHGLVFFDFPPERFGLFLDHWRSLFGHVLDKPVGNSTSDKVAVVRYVSKYITKKTFSSRSDDILNGVISAPRFVMSKGIGSSFVSRMYNYYRNCDVNTMVDRMFYTFDGKIKYPLPRFYKDRFYKKIKYKERYDVIFSEGHGAVSFLNFRYVKRYTSESLLSLAIADIVRNRSVARFCKSVRFEESKYSGSRKRFKTVASVRLNDIESKYDRSVADSSSLADEMNIRHFTDRHSLIT